jgi:glycerol-3-phosphate dehydrogenase
LRRGQVSHLKHFEASILETDRFSGIRPLVRDPHAKNTESLVRSHLISISKSGLLTCAGGKWTTYRQMAEEAVDRAVKQFNLKTKPIDYVPDIAGLNGIDMSVPLLNGTCQTHRIRLVGAHGYSTTLFINLVQHFGLDVDVAKHLATNYGDRAWDVAALAGEMDNTEHYPLRGQRLSSLFPFIDGEVRYAVRSEYAQTAVDVLARRTRLSFLNAQAALHSLPKVIDIMGDELHWSQQRKQTEWTETVQFLASMGLPQDMLQITREQVLAGEMSTSHLAPAQGSSRGIQPLRPTLEPVSHAEGALP